MATKTKTVKLTKFRPSDKAMKFVDFSRFCVNQGIESYEGAELVTLAERAFKAGERYCNSGSERDSRANETAGERFEIKAKALGFTVSWPGLWPRLEKVEADGVKRDVYLPTFKD
jgi:hypothetical protein